MKQKRFVIILIAYLAIMLISEKLHYLHIVLFFGQIKHMGKVVLVSVRHNVLGGALQ